MGGWTPQDTPCASSHHGTTRDAHGAMASVVPPPQRRAHCPVLVIVFIRLGGCNCPALLTSPGDEREATNSFAELLRYLISSNCSWGDRGKEQDSAVDGGKGKTVVKMGRKKGLEGTGGNRWDGVGAHTKKETGERPMEE